MLDFNKGFKLMSNVVTGMMIATVALVLMGLSNEHFNVGPGFIMLFGGLGGLAITAGGPWFKMGFWKFMYVVFNCFFTAVMSLWFALHAAADFKFDGGMYLFYAMPVVLAAFFVGVLYLSLKIVGPISQGLDAHGYHRRRTQIR